MIQSIGNYKNIKNSYSGQFKASLELTKKGQTIDCCHTGEYQYPYISQVRTLRMDTGLRRYDDIPLMIEY